MKKLLLAPVFLVAACGVDSVPPQDQSQVSTDDSAQAPEDDATTSETSTLVGGFTFSPASCDDHSVFLEGHYSYTDGTPTDNVVCQYQFADGSTLDSCFGLHSFANAEKVVLVIRDSVTGAVTQSEDIVQGPASLETTLAVTTSGLSISWDADVIYGGVAGVGRVSVSFDPADAVIVNDPAVLSERVGTVNVTEAGTYKVTLTGSLSFGEEGGCSQTIEKSIDVVCDGTH